MIETAGGVNSPSLSGRPQADVYRGFRIPSVLVGDSRLGGISQTISAFESLLLRGYQVESILLFENARYENHRYLSDYFREHHGVPVTTTAEPPAKSDSAQGDAEAMAAYYDGAGCHEAAASVLEHLRRRHSERIALLESLPQKAHRHIW